MADRIVDLKDIKMDKERATRLVQWLSTSPEAPTIHPEMARTLYRIAEMPLPDYLVPWKLKLSRAMQSSTLDRLETDFYSVLRIDNQILERIAQSRQLGMNYPTETDAVRAVQKSIDDFRRQIEKALFNTK